MQPSEYAGSAVNTNAQIHACLRYPVLWDHLAAGGGLAELSALGHGTDCLVTLTQDDGRAKVGARGSLN